MNEGGGREVWNEANEQQRRSNVTCDAARETVILGGLCAVIRRRVEASVRGPERFGVDRADRRDDGREKQDGESDPDVALHEERFYIH
jgi:hypothetical protein